MKEYSCTMCGTVIKKWPSQTHQRTFCTKLCRSQFMISLRGKQAHKTTCVICAQEFICRPSRDTKTCSKPCTSKYRSRKSGPAHPRWKGGWITNRGYRMVSGRLEHRLVMETSLGRKLDRFETVHHIDGNKLNNVLENLEVVSLSDHIKKHWREGHYANRKHTN